MLCRLFSKIQHIVIAEKKINKFNGLFDELILILLNNTKARRGYMRQ